MPASRKKKKGNSSTLIRDLKIVLALLIVFLLTSCYFIFLKSNTNIRSDKYYVFIPAGLDINQLGQLLKKEEIISNGLSFSFTADLLDLELPKKGGLFEIEKGWNNISLVQHFKNSKPLDYNFLEIKPYRLRKKILQDVSGQLSLDYKILQNTIEKIDSLGLDEKINKESAYCLFIPGKYKVPKGMNETEFLSTMYKIFLHFWNEERREKLEKIGINEYEAFILSSIVYSETKVYQEMPVIAGVYLNRLEKGMKLEADPTLVFASGNFGMRRVYINNKKLLYPEYNTYKHKGLPPGPIHFPSPEVIDAVLSFEDHNYYYFCAKGDTTGCHLFAETYDDHKVNAERFRKNLDLRKIFK